MYISEFYGAPGSGKSFLFNHLSKKNKNVENNKSIFYFYLYKTKKINQFRYKSLRFLILLNEKIRSNFLLTKLYFKITKNTENEKKLYFRKISKKYKVFLKLYFKYAAKINDINEKERVKNWIIQNIVGYDIANYKLKNILLFDSEGFFQRIFSLYLRVNIEKKDIIKLLRLCPKPKNIFYIVSKKKNISNAKNIGYEQKLHEIFKICKQSKIKIITINNKKYNISENILKIENIIKL